MFKEQNKYYKFFGKMIKKKNNFNIILYDFDRPYDYYGASMAVI